MSLNLQLPARVRAYPGFWLAVTALVAVTGAAAVDAARQGLRLRGALEQRARLRIELLSPQARPELVASAGAVLERAQAQLRLAKAAWPGVADSANAAAADRLAVFAELSAFVERRRERATAAGVVLARDERFGFTQHAETAPAGEIAPVVLAQMRAVEQVLAALFVARPEKLVGVWRENPRPEEAARDGEWYALPAGRSVRVPGLVASRAVRVAFVGSTACLRRFLNGLAAEPALVVREVTVAAEPRNEREAKVKGASRDQHRFTVGIEAVTVVGGTWAKGTTVELATEVQPVWRGPVEGRGEIFAMPAVDYVLEQRAWRRTVSGAAAVEGAALTLVEVRRVPYRWRLVGNAGERTALFEETGGRRSVLLTVGGCDAESGIGLEALELVRTENGGRLLRAQVRDPQEKAPVVLTMAGNGGAERVLAVLRLRGQPELVSVVEGASVAVGEERYAVGRIVAEPASVWITRLGGEGADAAPVQLRAAAK